METRESVWESVLICSDFYARSAHLIARLRYPPLPGDNRGDRFG